MLKGDEPFMKKKDEQNLDNMVAPGIDDHEEFDKQATEEDIKKGEYTSVTTLSLDEVNPS